MPRSFARSHRYPTGHERHHHTHLDHQPSIAPPRGEAWILRGEGATAGLLDNVGADYLWARAVLLVGPTIASAGMTIQVSGSPNRRHHRSLDAMFKASRCDTALPLDRWNN
jgi:hypothetical protein